jgi:hypothetical protein
MINLFGVYHYDAHDAILDTRLSAGIGRGQTLGNFTGVFMGCVPGHLSLDRHHDVQALAARCFWPGSQPSLRIRSRSRKAVSTTNSHSMP